MRLGLGAVEGEESAAGGATEGGGVELEEEGSDDASAAAASTDCRDDEMEDIARAALMMDDVMRSPYDTGAAGCVVFSATHGKNSMVVIMVIALLADE